MNLKTLDVAQQWIDLGYSVFPVSYRSKRPAFDALRMTGSVKDGTPTWSPFKERLATADELKTWFTGPRRNLGIITGWAGLVVLDFDTIEGYEMWCSWADSVGGIAAECKAHTMRVYSARGVHLYITCTDPVTPYRVADIDVKATWGYVLAPPSIHPSGSEYRGLGQDILHCEHLCDIFPLEKPESVAVITDAMVINDPWEAANCAVECGGMGSIERIKATLRIETLLPVAGRGKRFMIPCFAHLDKNPSMQVDLNRQTAYCFGCGWHGDAIEIYAALNHMSNREAIAALA